jgi:hypothetical protein
MEEPFLRGAAAIADELKKLGIIAEDDPDPEGKVYYLDRTMKFDRFGRQFISTPSKLRQLVNKQIT